MDNVQYNSNKTNTLIPLSQEILGINQQQSTGVINGYNVMNPDMTRDSGMVISDSAGGVYNVNKAGVATWYPSSDIYSKTSGKNGMPGTGNLHNDKPIIKNLPYAINRKALGYDTQSQLYINGSVRTNQSTGDEMANVFAGTVPPIDIQYQTCVASPTPYDPSNLINADMKIIEATLGGNCGVPKGNITTKAQEYMHGVYGHNTFQFHASSPMFPDPAVGCYKQMSVTYECNGETKTQSGYYDSSGEMQISCQPKSTISDCYSKAIASNASYFGLANVDVNTSRGTCYLSNSDAFKSRKWTNPGIPLWKIQVSDLSGSTKARNMAVYLGLNGNLFFGDNNQYNETYALSSFCKAGKLPGCSQGGDSIFKFDQSKNNGVSCLLLANDGNMYIFRFITPIPNFPTVPSDIKDNPTKYLQNLIYSSKTSSATLSKGWDSTEISTGVSNNIFYSKVDPALTYSQSIYSADGRLRLTFDNDNSHNSLTLYTGDPKYTGCTQSLGGESWDGIDGVAMNYINKQSADVTNALGKLAYVNRLGTSYEYTDNQLTSLSDKYTVNPGVTINSISSNSNATKVSDGYIYDSGSSSLEKCQQNCSKSSNCVAAVVDNQSCYLINNLDDDDVIYSSGTDTSVASNAAKSYTKYKGKSLGGYDLPGGGAYYKSAEDCMNYCNKTSGCSGIQYWGTSCWYKTADGAANISKMTNNSSSDVYILNPTTQVFWNKYPNKQLYGYDLPGSGATKSTAGDCLDYCTATSGCKGIQYIGGKCYTKSSDGTSDLSHIKDRSDSDVYISGKPILIPPNLMLRVPTVKKQGGSTASYTTYPNKGVAGYDLPGSEGSGPVKSTPELCVDYCSSTSGCKGVQYERDTGKCWLKSSAGIPDVSPIVDNGVTDVYIRDEVSAGVSYLISDQVNVIDTKKYINYNISGNPMTPDVTDVSLMPGSIASNFNTSNQALVDVNEKVVKNTQSILNEAFTGREKTYMGNTKLIGKMKETTQNYYAEKPLLSAEINTMNKMMSNSYIQMDHLNIVYSSLFIISLIFLIIAFSISL